MKIADIRVREVSVPRIYDTYSADVQKLQSADERGRSRYQIIELFTEDGIVGLGEVSDIYDRMQPLSAADLRNLLQRELAGGDVARWPLLYQRVAAALPDTYHPELRGLTLFGVEIALLDLVGKRFDAPLYELLGGRCRDGVEVCWVGFLRGEIPMAEELAAFEAEIAAKVAQGMRAFKLKVGEDHPRDLARIELFRQIAGPDLYLRVDASGSWQELEAIDKIGQMARAGVNACETPVVAISRQVANDNPEQINARADEAALSLARVRAAVPIDIIEHVADLGGAGAPQGCGRGQCDPLARWWADAGPAPDPHRSDRGYGSALGQHGRDGAGNGGLRPPRRGGAECDRVFRSGRPWLTGRRCVCASVRVPGRRTETICGPRARCSVGRGQDGEMGALKKLMVR